MSPLLLVPLVWRGWTQLWSRSMVSMATMVLMEGYPMAKTINFTGPCHILWITTLKGILLGGKLIIQPQWINNFRRTLPQPPLSSSHLPLKPPPSNTVNNGYGLSDFFTRTNRDFDWIWQRILVIHLAVMWIYKKLSSSIFEENYLAQCFSKTQLFKFLLWKCYIIRY